MNAHIVPKKICLGQSILLLLLLGLTACSQSEDLNVEDHLSDVVENLSAGEGFEPISEILTYTNQDYGFEFTYPETWKLSEKDHGVVLKKDPHRLDIRFRDKDEVFDPHSIRTGLPAGDLIYEDKILFMDQVIPAEYLIFEKKYKAVYYGGPGRIEDDDLLFWIALEDLETADYREIDLTEELLIEAKSIVESFKRVDKAGDSVLGSIASKSGLIAQLEMPERLPVGESLNIKFTLKNVSDMPIYVLQWYTPLEGIAGEIFQVTLDGKTIPYQGILASRIPPTPDAYVLLTPGESVSAVVDLSKSFDFSKVGTYRIKFISPRISHVARTEAEMATTMEELGPVDIPSNEVSIEIVASNQIETNSRLRTLEEAKHMIVAYLRERGHDLGLEPIFTVEELHTENLWSALQAQLFRIREGKFFNESFLLWGSKVFQLGKVEGGQGLNSLVVADIDQNHRAELFYAYSFGSDVQQSRIGMFSPVFQEGFLLESDIGYFGTLGVYSEDWSHVGVRVIQADQNAKMLGNQDILGYLSIELDDGKELFGLKLYKIPPQDILENLFSVQDHSKD